MQVIDLRDALNVLRIMEERRHVDFPRTHIGIAIKDIKGACATITKGTVILFKPNVDPHEVTVEVPRTKREIEDPTNKISQFLTHTTIVGVPQDYITEILINPAQI